MHPLLALGADELRSHARTLIPPRGQGAHWSQQSLVLGRVHDEETWRRYFDADGVAYASFREWATEELGLPGDESVTLVKLWAMQKAGRDRGIPFDAWRAITKTRATAMRRLVAGGADIRACLDLSAKYDKADDFDRAVRLKLGGPEVWHRAVIRMPDATVQVWNAALVRALETLDPTASPDRIHDRDIEHQLVAAIAASFLLGAEVSER